MNRTSSSNEFSGKKLNAGLRGLGERDKISRLCKKVFSNPISAKAENKKWQPGTQRSGVTGESG